MIEHGILPLMAVEQLTKGKVRPVLHNRELNKGIECHTGDDVIDVCSETLREWRQMDGITLVDMKSAYLQIRVDKKLWPYQLVEYRNNIYCLTENNLQLESFMFFIISVISCVLVFGVNVNRAFLLFWVIFHIACL